MIRVFFFSVIDVSKKTGDYASLSFVDLKVIALTLELHIENCGRESVVFDVHPKPPIWEDVRELKRKQLEEKNAANQEKKQTAEKEMSEALERLDIQESVAQENNEKVESNQSTENPDVLNNGLTKDVDEQEDSGNCEDQGDSAADEEQESGESEESEEEQDQTGKKRSGFGEWIDESNIQEVVARMEAPADLAERRMEVACLTTDFALQNVLLHMKLNICSIDGIKVNRLRSYILRCRFVSCNL